MKEGENALKSAGSFSPKRKSNGSPSPKAAPQLIDGACVCGRIKFTMPDHPKPYAIYKCHCNKCRQLGSRNGGITWVGFESQQVKFANWHVDLLKIHGKRAACPDCSCSIYMAYADDYVYIDERRLVDGARYTRPSYLSTLHRKYQRRKHGICVGHIYTKSEGLPPDYGFDPPDIPKFDQDANWIRSMVFAWGIFTQNQKGYPQITDLIRQIFQNLTKTQTGFKAWFKGNAHHVIIIVLTEQVSVKWSF